MHVRIRSLAAIVAALVFGLGIVASADEAPIAGRVKSVDPPAGTLVVESAGTGKVREVVIHVRPDSKVVRFARSMDPGKPGFSEQPASLADVKPGWPVSVKTKHEGDKEVAELVRVVHEK
jgi:hypothetical protein